MRERATPTSRVQKVLEGTNLKLAAVVAGEADPATLAELAQGRLRKKREQIEQALVGGVQPHHRFLLAELRAQIDGLDATVARFDAEIARRCVADEQEAVVQRMRQNWDGGHCRPVSRTA